MGEAVCPGPRARSMANSLAAWVPDDVVTFHLLLVLGGAAGYLLAWTRRADPPSRRLLAALLPLAALVAMAGMALQVLTAPYEEWNSARLAPSFALSLGHPIYPGKDEGPVLNTIYGPLAYLAYLPAVLARSPDEACMIGVTLAAVMFLTPWILFLLAPLREDPIGTLAAFLGLVLLTLSIYGLRYSAFLVHADAPLLCLGGVACWLLRRGNGSDHARAPLAACLAAASCLVKQTGLFLVPGLVIHVTREGGARSACRFLAHGLLATTALVLLSLARFDASGLGFNMITIPSSHAWGSNLPHVAGELALLLFPVLLVIFGGSRREGPGPDVVLLTVAGLSMMPAALLGRVKVGGDLNSFTVCLYYLLPAAALALLTCRASRWRDGVLVLLLLSGIVRHVGSIDLLLRSGERPPSGEAMAFAFLRRYPDRAYFPWSPLPALMADRRLGHFAHGVTDRALAGSAPKPEVFQRYLPEHLEWVAFDERFEGVRMDIMDYFQDFERVEPPPGLEGWTVFARPTPVSGPDR